MSTPFLAEIRLFSFDFPPKGWALCDGQVLPINQNAALFSLLGTTYGGNGTTNFQLPDLQGRVPMHVGNGILLGQSSGEEAHTLLSNEMPAHVHGVVAAATAADQVSPAGNVWADPGKAAYGTTVTGAMAPAALTSVGGSLPHDNMAPFTVLNYCIALVGIFPSRN